MGRFVPGYQLWAGRGQPRDLASPWGSCHTGCFLGVTFISLLAGHVQARQGQKTVLLRGREPKSTFTSMRSGQCKEERICSGKGKRRREFPRHRLPCSSRRERENAGPWGAIGPITQLLSPLPAVQNPGCTLKKSFMFAQQSRRPVQLLQDIQDREMPIRTSLNFPLQAFQHLLGAQEGPCLGGREDVPKLSWR